MLLPIFIGCAAPVEAPTELSELTGWLFEAYDAEEDVLAAGLSNLSAQLSAPPEDGYLLTPLTAANVADIDHPERRLAEALGLAIAASSPFEPDAHIALMKLSDLTPISPSADQFDRSFITDPTCFPAGCDELLTTSDIYRSNMLVSMGFTIDKDHRQVTLEDGRAALIARGWMAESAHGEDGNNHLWQSYELDIWLPAENGGTLRMLAMWSEAEYAGVSDELGINMVRMGIKEGLSAQDEYLSTQ